MSTVAKRGIRRGRRELSTPNQLPTAGNQPSRSISARIRSRISSRISRTSAIAFPLGSSSGQSSRFSPRNDRTLIATTHRDQHLRLAAPSSGVNFDVGAPTDRRPLRASRRPLRDARADRDPCPRRLRAPWSGSVSRLNHAAAICDRPALWTHAKRTVFMMPTSQSEA